MNNSTQTLAGARFVIRSMRWVLVAGLFALVAVFVLPVLGQTADPDLPSETTLRMAEPFIVMFAKQYTWICSVLIALGTVRLVAKPIVVAWHWMVAQTATPVDDRFLEKAERTRGWKVFFFLIDWLGSIKLPPKPDNQTSNPK